jgi:hypothetical protein
MADEKKRGRGNPTPKFIGPKLPDAGRGDLHDPSKPKCNEPYKFKGVWKRCGKRGRHLKHGPGKG